MSPLFLCKRFKVDALLFSVGQDLEEAGPSLLPFKLESQQFDLPFEDCNLPLVVLKGAVHRLVEFSGGVLGCILERVSTLLIYVQVGE